jgi:Galactose oxidase, central domain
MKRTTSATQYPFVLILALLGLAGLATFALEPVALAQVNPSWTPTGSLNIARVYHTATVLPNGKVLVTGGRGYNYEALNSAELYDPATGTWSITGRFFGIWHSRKRPWWWRDI